MIDVLLLVILAMLYTGQSYFNKMYSASRNGAGTEQFSVIYGAFAGIATFAVNGLRYAPSKITLSLGLLNAIMLILYNLSMQRSAHLGSFAFLMVCSLSGGMMFPLIYDVLFLGTHLKIYQYLAFAFVLAAGIIMNMDGFRDKKSGKYLAWCLVLAVSNGLYGIIMNYQQQLMDFTKRNEMIMTTFLGVTVMLSASQLIVRPKRFLEDFKMSGISLVYLLSSAACATVAVNLLLFLMKRFSVTLLNVADNGGVLVLSMILAVTALKEKVNKKSVVGFILACAGIILLSL